MYCPDDPRLDPDYGFPVEKDDGKMKTATASQTDLILRYMKKHGSITPQEAMSAECHRCMRLAARIADLKALGYSIIRTIETEKNTWGEKVRYARYSLAGGGKNEYTRKSNA